MKSSQIIKDAVGNVLSQAVPVDCTKRSALLANLTFVYHLIIASENLLRVAADNTEPGKLKKYYEQHQYEESGHASWLAADLAEAGVIAENTATPRIAVEMCGSQYYLIQHVDSCALLGYMVLMECFPKPTTLIEQLEQMHGKELLRTCRYHAENDIDHGSDILDIIDSLPEYRQRLVLENAIQSARYFVLAMQSFV